MSPESPSIQAPQSGHEEVEQNVIAVILSQDPPFVADNKPSDNHPDLSPPSLQVPTLGDKAQSTDPSTSPSSSPSARNSSRSPPPGTINMTGLRTALPDIALNSPSTNIIGTPFAYTTTNTPFEYPFPDTASSDSAHSPPSHPSYRPGSPQASLHYPYPSFQPPPPADAASIGPTVPLNLVHPKFKSPPPASPPPMPPSLRKKRWSLKFLGRRRTSNPPTPGEGTPPPGSPPSVTSGAILGGLGSGRPSRSSSSGIKAPEDSRKQCVDAA